MRVHDGIHVASNLFLCRPFPLLLLVLLEVRGGEGALVALAEEEVLQLLVVVERPLQLLQLGHVLLRVLLVAILGFFDVRTDVQFMQLNNH